MLAFTANPIIIAIKAIGICTNHMELANANRTTIQVRRCRRNTYINPYSIPLIDGRRILRRSPVVESAADAAMPDPQALTPCPYAESTVVLFQMLPDPIAYISG